MTGEPGVMIPVQNIINLMLRRDGLEAVAADPFKIYAVSAINEGIEMLTSFSAGDRTGRGCF
jgi:predicted ATP-dependent protease